MSLFKIVLTSTLLLINAQGFSKGAAFQDSFSNIRSKAQVYQYFRNYVEVGYDTASIDYKIEIEDLSGATDPITVDIPSSATGIGGTGIASFSNSFWVGLDYEQVTTTLESSNTFNSNTSKTDGSKTRINPFGAFKIGSSLVISAGLLQTSSTSKTEDSTDTDPAEEQTSSSSQYEVGVLVHGNQWEAGVDVLTGDQQDNSDDDTKLDVEEASEYTLHGRVNMGGFEVGGAYAMINEEEADLSDPKDRKNFTSILVRAKYMGIFAGYVITSARYANEEDKGISSIASNTIIAGYDGLLGNIQLGANYQMVTAEEDYTDDSTPPGSKSTYTSPGTAMSFSVGLNF